MEPMSLSAMREAIYKNLNKVTQLQVKMPNARLGYPAPNNPRPSVDTVNLAIQMAIADINSEVEFAETGQPLSITLSAQTAVGAYYYDLNQATSGKTAYDITFITHVWFTPTSGRSVILTPTTFPALSRDEREWPNEGPGTPRHYMQQGYQLAIWPANEQAGTLSVGVGLELHTPASDIETIGFLPGSKYVPFLDVATARLCLMNQEDLAMKAQLEIYAPLGKAGVDRLKHWLGSFCQELQPRTTFESHRVFVGRSR